MCYNINSLKKGGVMKKIGKIFVAVLVGISLLASISLAQDLNQVVDQFYAGLADIIERNMDNPDQCVREVEDFYAANQETVNKIRQAAQEAMKELSPMIDKYKSMTQEEIEALHQEAREKQIGQTDFPEVTLPPLADGADRYAQAIQAFAAKYPEAGMKIAAKAMNFYLISVG